MRRREFISLLGGTAMAWPMLVRAQETRAPRIGFLYPGLAATALTRIAAFRDGLRASGWRDDQIVVLARSAEGDTARNAQMAAELIDSKVDVLVPISSIAVEAVRTRTKTISVVAFDLETDPVASGIAASLAHPGGNITGVFFDFPDFSTKWMQLLKETIPHLASVVVLQDPASPSPQLKGVKVAAGLLNVKLEVIEVRAASDLDEAFRSASQRAPDAALMLSSPLFGTNPKRVADLALNYRLPAVTLFPEFARFGGLMAYGVNLPDAFQQTGVMAGKVLSGARPADLPVERPTKFELVVNLKTAKALGVDLPTSILLRADEVIE